MRDQQRPASPVDQDASNADDKRGAIPPTGGVPPEDAAPHASRAADERSATDDLVDGIDLMLRAARKALKSVDPRIEAAAERALGQLQALDAQAVESLQQKLGVDPKQLDALTADVGREMAAFVERVSQRVDATFRRSR